jgi:hypothetical protein
MHYLSPLLVLFFALPLSAQSGNQPMGRETEPGSRDTFRKPALSILADTIYKVNPPDPLGNVTFWVSPRRAGLMNAQSKVIYPPIYRDVQWLDEKGHYILKTGDGTRSYRYSVGNTEGVITIDTVIMAFEPVLFAKVDPLKGLPYSDYDSVVWGRTTDFLRAEHIAVRLQQVDTLPFLIYKLFSQSSTGLWHRKLGRLLPPEYYQIRVVSDSTYTAMMKDRRSYLFHVDGRVLAGPYNTIEVFGNPPRYLVARIIGSPNSKGTHLVQLDLEGRFIQDLYSDIYQLTADRYVMLRTKKNPDTRQLEQRYALFDEYLNPVTDFIFDTRVKSRFQLSPKDKNRLLNRELPAGYSPWVGYTKKRSDGTIILIDRAGRTYETSQD